MNQVHVINLPHRLDRRASAEQQAREQGFEIMFWEGIVDRHNRRRGVCMAHKQIVRHAKENNLPMVCIMEDDCIFYKGDGSAWQYYLENIPDDFDIYLGQIYVGEIDHESKILNGWSGMTLYIVHERYYTTFLSIPDDAHIDQANGEKAFMQRFIVCNPFVVYQDGSYSDHLLSRGNYTPMLKDRKLFGTGR